MDDNEPPDDLPAAATDGDESAASALLPLVYDELRATARRLLGPQGRHHTLQPTALVHDAYMKLSKNGGEWENRRHFLCVAAKAMRQILSDHAAKRKSQKRGGGWQRVTLNGELISGLAGNVESVDLVALDEALSELAEADPRGARVVELRFFTGMTIEEVAVSIVASPTTVKEDWRAARNWLRWRLSAAE
jgi:RNA polymerase sigma factor (TIGR02999 family)